MSYTVQPGETLWSIAARYGTTVQAIMQANGLTNPNAIYPGLRLYIPISGGQPYPPGPPFPPPPGPPGGGSLERRVDRLERQVDRLNNEVDRLERRVNRLEQGPR